MADRRLTPFNENPRKGGEFPGLGHEAASLPDNVPVKYAVKRQTAVTAHLKSEQLLLFAFARWRWVPCEVV